ncbi:MAG: hypothetical protein CMJ18_21755 [Phycisphaeraceae bacterium]|nr:hypothetical protein [Phycisphaeraceae bacterium]
MAQDVVDIGDRKQLFIDGRWLRNAHGVKLTVNPPVKHERVLTPDHPWESRFIGHYKTIIEHEGRLHLWYLASGPSTSNDRATHHQSTCYATSRDGLHWERPSTGVIEWEGHRDNNIVMCGTDEISVMLDPNGPDEHRFKALSPVNETPVWPESLKANTCKPCPPDNMYYECHLLTSPDGIHWKIAGVVSPYAHDNNNHFFFDRRLNRYVAYFRWNVCDNVCGIQRIRTLGRLEFDDPMQLPWPYRLNAASNVLPDGRVGWQGGEFPIVMEADQQDPFLPCTDINDAPVVQYPWADDSYYLSFPSFYRHYDQDVIPVEACAYEDPQRANVTNRHNTGVKDVQLAVSAEGVNWERPERKPYIPLGLEGDWDGGMTYAGLGLVRRDDEIWMYFSGVQARHGTADHRRTYGGIARLVQRLDGFVSADFDYTGGEFTTPLVRFSGTHLLLNVDCSALGEVRVELRDERGIPIGAYNRSGPYRGYSMAESIPIDRNHLAVAARWRDHDDVAALIGRPVRLHFRGRAAKLYSFQFVTP